MNLIKINRVNSEKENKPITVNELKDTFYYLKTNKSAGYGDISYNVVENCFGKLCDPILHIFNLSSSKLVTAVTAACFSKILEPIIYNRVYTYLQKNKTLYYKQSGFQAGYSIDHAIIQLLYQKIRNKEKIINNLKGEVSYLSEKLEKLEESIDAHQQCSRRNFLFSMALKKLKVKTLTTLS